MDDIYLKEGVCIIDRPDQLIIWGRYDTSNNLWRCGNENVAIELP